MLKLTRPFHDFEFFHDRLGCLSLVFTDPKNREHDSVVKSARSPRQREDRIASDRFFGQVRTRLYDRVVWADITFIARFIPVKDTSGALSLAFQHDRTPLRAASPRRTATD